VPPPHVRTRAHTHTCVHAESSQLFDTARWVRGWEVRQHTRHELTRHEFSSRASWPWGAYGWGGEAAHTHTRTHAHTLSRAHTHSYTRPARARFLSRRSPPLPPPFSSSLLNTLLLRFQTPSSHADDLGKPVFRRALLLHFCCAAVALLLRCCFAAVALVLRAASRLSPALERTF